MYMYRKNRIYALQNGRMCDCFCSRTCKTDRNGYSKRAIQAAKKVYIQSALNVDTEAKKSQETFSLKNSGDFFRKIVIVDGNAKALDRRGRHHLRRCHPVPVGWCSHTIALTHLYHNSQYLDLRCWLLRLHAPLSLSFIER